MQDRFKSFLSRLGALLLAEVFKPIEEIKVTQKAFCDRFDRIESKVERLEARIEKLHSVDPIITECDLASLDNQISTRIAKCRDRGYTTAEDRRIIPRMHSVYKQRGGNHGEETEYAVFCHMLTEEEYKRSRGEAV